MKLTNELTSYKLKASSGQVLLEAVVSLTIITFSILGIFALLSGSIGQSRVSANQAIAVNLAAEGIEVVKNILDKNHVSDSGAWNDGLIRCGSGCSVQWNSGSLGSSQNEPLKLDPDERIYSYDTGDDTIFHREIRINTATGGNELIVVSTVTWKDRGGLEYKVVLEDRFFNWRDNN